MRPALLVVVALLAAGLLAGAGCRGDNDNAKNRAVCEKLQTVLDLNAERAPPDQIAIARREAIDAANAAPDRDLARATRAAFSGSAPTDALRPLNRCKELGRPLEPASTTP